VAAASRDERAKRPPNAIMPGVSPGPPVRRNGTHAHLGGTCISVSCRHDQHDDRRAEISVRAFSKASHITHVSPASWSAAAAGRSLPRRTTSIIAGFT